MWAPVKIEIGSTSAASYIRIWGCTWGEITGMGDLPFMNSKLALETFHQGGAAGREVTGKVANIPASDNSHDLSLHMEDLSGQIPFEFVIDWNEFQLTMDLGVQKLIEKILKSAQITGLSSVGLLPGLRGLFELLKKPERVE